METANEIIKPIIIHKGERNNYTSTIIIDRENEIVEKIISYGELSSDLFYREVYWLQRLANTGVVPYILGQDPQKYKIIMNWCGEHLSHDNKPDDVYEQLFKIQMILLQNHCYYNDWKYGNFLVKNGKITIIDFGWCPKIVEYYQCTDEHEIKIISKPCGNFFHNIFEKNNG